MPTPQRNTVPIRWVPRGACDSADGTNSPQGSMAALANLIPDPTTSGVWVPRPAATEKTVFAGFTAPGVISAELVVGDIAYGMIASGRNVGSDEPFAYNLATAAFLTVGGITSSNVPTTQPTAGDWTPPIMALVGSRVIVTHPGFPGGTIKLGWFDISGAAIATTGDTISGAPLILGNPNILGVQPGMLVAGTNIPAGAEVLMTAGPLTNATVIVGTTVAGSPFLTVTAAYGPYMEQGAPVFSQAFPIGTVSAQTGNLAGPIQLSQNATTTGSTVAIFDINDGSLGPVVNAGNTHTSTLLDGITYGTSGMFAGMAIFGPGIPSGTTIAAIVGANSLTLSQAATTSTTISFNVVGTYVVLTANATGTASGTAITITGGTAAAPLWGAGDTDRNPLPSQPVGVTQFNGRAYYALGTDGIVYSDSLLPCRVSNSLAVQALTTGDGLAVTAVAPLLLSAPLTGSIVQALIVVQGQSRMRQITGDQATGNLAMNLMPVATGTLAPLSLAPCELGTGFISPEGLRFVRFDGTVSEPIGEGGDGIVTPFQYAISPSRICAAANGGVLRISVQNGSEGSAPFEEWWYDLRRKVWSGPHSFPARLIQPWRGSFALAPQRVDASLWQSDWFANATSGYVENGAPLSWRAATVLLPDNAQIVMNAMVEGSIALAADVAVSVAALDEDGNVIDSVDLPTGDLSLRQLPLYWHEPIVFKQMSIAASGESDFTVRVGNIYLRYEILGYNSAIVTAAPGYLLADDGVTILADNPGSTLLTPG